MKWTVGQPVIVTSPSNRQVEVVERTVTKVGRKWITVAGAWTEERFDHNGLGESQTGWRSRLWPDLSTYEAHVARQSAWSKFHSLVRQQNHAPDHLTTEQIELLATQVEGASPSLDEGERQP